MRHINREDIAGYDKRYRTNLINSISGFKSVALIGTINNQGATNLAIFSQIIHIGANPPLTGILFRPHSVPRHTLENIIQTGSFSINHISRDFVREAHHTSANWEISEFEACNFTPEFIENVKSPFVKEAKVKIGCEFRERQDIKINGTILIIGEMMHILLPEEIIQQDGFVDLEQADSLSTLGLDAYYSSQRVGRYSYARAAEPLKEI
ncbi:MAG: flavin reductase family protein [Cyclobacteriaceae bacterium]